MALHLGWQVRHLNIDDPAGALRLFQSNRDAGLMLTAAMVLTHLAG
jgi:4-hydroxybenzoate polyprenyltransferase